MAKETDLLSNPEKSTETIIDELNEKQANSNINQCSIIDIENIAKELLSSLPKVNRDVLRKEMSEMIVTIKKTPTTYDINEGLALSQGYRDRLSEIYILAQKDYKIRKRCLEMLFDAVNLISKASSQDKRRGEATMKYPVMVLQVEASEIFLKEVEQLLSNMKTTSDSVSRQASVLQMQINLGEIVRKNNDSNAEETTRGNRQLNSWGDFK